MEMEIKQLTLGNKVFIPQTTAEAVLVKDGDNVIRLDEALARKSGVVITPLTSGLKSYAHDGGVIITHSNNVESVETPRPLMVAYDQHGHITGSVPVSKLKIKVMGNSHIEFDGSLTLTIDLGDDFTIENDEIKLNWVEHGNT